MFGLVLWFSAAHAAADGLKVVVRNDAGEALPYAYLYVGRKAVAVTDSLGVGTIPAAKLAVGDTVSVSYVGTEPQRAVYDAAMQRKGSWEAVLVETIRHSLTADEVVIRADIEALFRRSVKKFWMLYVPHQATARFSIRNGKRKIDGRATATHQPGDTSDMTYLRRRIFWYHLPLSIDEMTGDTAMITTEAVHADLHLGFYYPAFALAIAMRDARHSKGAQFGYLGKREGCRLFRIVYPEVREGKGRYSLQFMVWVGEEERRILRVEVHSVNLDQEKRWTHIDATYGLSPINARTLVFERVEASCPEWSVELRDPEYRPIRATKQKKPKKRT